MSDSVTGATLQGDTRSIERVRKYGRVLIIVENLPVPVRPARLAGGAHAGGRRLRRCRSSARRRRATKKSFEQIDGIDIHRHRAACRGGRRARLRARIQRGARHGILAVAARSSSGAASTSSTPAIRRTPSSSSAASTSCSARSSCSITTTSTPSSTKRSSASAASAGACWSRWSA